LGKIKTAEKLGKKIDLVTTDGISGVFKENIEKDFVEIYEI
jgi:predicted nucleotidyltransferase